MIQATASKIAVISKTSITYRDTLTTEKIRYYWLKVRDINGNVSSFSPVAVDKTTIYVPNN